MACLVCRSEIKPVISFGQQPIANGFLSPEKFKDEYFFELKIGWCPKCAMVQLLEQPEPEMMFNENYAFFSGTSRYMAVHFEKFAKTMMDRYVKGSNSFVVEIGSNDGIMLKHFKNAGVGHLGIEPSANVAAVAKKEGINTWVRFFNAETARAIVKEYGQADGFVAANVMCHLPDLHSIAEGIKILIKDKGVVAFEDPYLMDVLEKVSYDQVYDEHMCLFSATSIQYLFNQYGMELIDVEPQITHGGSMRYYIGHKGQHTVSKNVDQFLTMEKEKGILKEQTFKKFYDDCEKSKADLMTLLKSLKEQKKRVVGYAATSKSTTVINYCGITPDLVEFISDTTPIKQGKFSPGKHIPILPVEKFAANPPDYALLFGWNHKNEIMEKEKNFTERGGRWITYVPKVEII